MTGAAHVRRHLLTAPWWVLALVQGGLFGTIWTLSGRFLQGQSWTGALIVGVLAGVFFGLVMGRWQHRQNAELREAAGDPSGEGLAGLPWRWRWSVPEDAEQRARTLAVMTHQERLLRRQRRWAVPFFVVMLALAVWLAIDDSPWWWLGVVLWSLALAGHVLLPRRLRRYVDRLRAPG